MLQSVRQKFTKHPNRLSAMTDRSFFGIRHFSKRSAVWGIEENWIVAEAVGTGRRVGQLALH